MKKEKRKSLKQASKAVAIAKRASARLEKQKSSGEQQQQQEQSGTDGAVPGLLVRKRSKSEDSMKRFNRAISGRRSSVGGGGGGSSSDDEAILGRRVHTEGGGSERIGNTRLSINSNDSDECDYDGGLSDGEEEALGVAVGNHRIHSVELELGLPSIDETASPSPKSQDTMMSSPNRKRSVSSPDQVKNLAFPLIDRKSPTIAPALSSSSSRSSMRRSQRNSKGGDEFDNEYDDDYGDIEKLSKELFHDDDGPEVEQVKGKIPPLLNSLSNRRISNSSFKASSVVPEYIVNKR
jgi:hypothetical protein